MLNKLLTLGVICLVTSSCRLITAPVTAVLGLPTMLSGGLAAAVNPDGREGYEIDTHKILFNDGKRKYRRYVHVYGRKAGGGYKTLGMYGDTAAFAISDNRMAKLEYGYIPHSFGVKQLTISSSNGKDFCYKHPVQNLWLDYGLLGGSPGVDTTAAKPGTLQLPANYKIDVITYSNSGKFVNLAEMNRILKKQGIPPLKPQEGLD